MSFRRPSHSGNSRRRSRSLAEFLPLIALGLAAGLALWAVAAVLWMIGHRLPYPYDLEWMEGGMLSHALRLSQGKPIYVAPSVDFVPHLYTPLYPGLLALLGTFTGGVGYVLGRVVSVASFVAALLLGARWAHRVGRSWPAALIGMALPLATFADTGGFYDLVRCDSLQLVLTVLGADLAYHGRASHRRMALAACVLVLAFFAKQTAAPMIVFVGGALLLTRRPAVITFTLVGVATFSLGCWLLNWTSGGWFWTYIFRLHQTHSFFAHRAFIETPRHLLALLGLGLCLVPWALLAPRARPAVVDASASAPHDLWFLAWLAFGGLLSAALSFGTQWAHTNAYIPGIYFPAIAIGASAGRLLTRAPAHPPSPPAERRPVRHALVARQVAVWGMLSLSLYPRLAALTPRQHVPTQADRQAGDRLIAQLAATPGDVLIPFHPFYAHLAHKAVYLHRMGIWDVRGTPADPVRGLHAALLQRRFSLIVFDDKVEATWFDWPEVLMHYAVVERIVGPTVVEGARTTPALLLQPKPLTDTP